MSTAPSPMPSMLYLQLDPSYDPLFVPETELADIDAVAQAIQTRLWLFEGEWWEDLNEGTPMFQQILGYRQSTNGQQLAAVALTARVMGTPYVIGVQNVNITFNPATRFFSYSATVYTSFGTVQIAGPTVPTPGSGGEIMQP